MRKPLTAVLGCGPSGLLAAHALEMRSVPFVILSKKQKSVLGGAQYSHIPIPGYHDTDDSEVKLTYEVIGSPEVYKEKVYGNAPVPFVSMTHRRDGEIVPAWSLTSLYDQLWDTYVDRIVDVPLSPERVWRLLEGFDLVLSSVPLTKLCKATVDPDVQHWFKSQPVRIYNEAVDPSLPDNTIRYDGTEEHSYYRMSRIFGVGSTEWGGTGAVPPLPNLISVSKPIGTNCDCFESSIEGDDVPYGLVKIGRFGTWKKGQLTFHAYNRVIDVLALRFGVGV